MSYMIPYEYINLLLSPVVVLPDIRTSLFSLSLPLPLSLSFISCCLALACFLVVHLAASSFPIRPCFHSRPSLSITQYITLQLPALTIPSLVANCSTTLAPSISGLKTQHRHSWEQTQGGAPNPPCDPDPARIPLPPLGPRRAHKTRTSANFLIRRPASVPPQNISLSPPALATRQAISGNTSGLVSSRSFLLRAMYI